MLLHLGLPRENFFSGDSGNIPGLIRFEIPGNLSGSQNILGMNSSSSSLMMLFLISTTSGLWIFRLSLESRESLLSLSGFFMLRFRTGADEGRSSLFEDGRMDETPEEVLPEEAALAADPVDSHSNESVPLSPRLWLMYSLFFGTNRTEPATIDNR